MEENTYERDILEAAVDGKLVWKRDGIAEIGCIVYVGNPSGEKQMFPPDASNPAENAKYGAAFERLVNRGELTLARDGGLYIRT